MFPEHGACTPQLSDGGQQPAREQTKVVILIIGYHMQHITQTNKEHWFGVTKVIPVVYLKGAGKWATPGNMVPCKFPCTRSRETSRLSTAIRKSYMYSVLVTL